VGPVHDASLGIVIIRRLSTQFTPKKLRHLTRRAVQRTCDVDHVRYGRLDAVAAALDLADDARHLVAVFRVVDGLGARYIYYLSHGSDLYRDYCCWACRTLYGLALALRFSRSGMHTKWCRMDRLMCVMAPACVLRVLAVVCASMPSSDMAEVGGRGTVAPLKEAVGTLGKPSGTLYCGVFWTLGFENKLSIKSGLLDSAPRAKRAAAASLQPAKA
jgi:hypothetical protein